MKHKVVYTIGACLAAVLTAVLTQTALPRASAAPGATPPHPRLVAAGADSNDPQVFTLRYVAFVAQPKTMGVAAQYNKGFPPVLAKRLELNSRHAMTSTPEGFIKVLEAEQPDYNFKIGLAGSAVLYDSKAVRTQISDGPNPADPYGLILMDNITINQKSDTTLDVSSEGTFSERVPASGNLYGTTGWRRGTVEIQIGQTYQWGADTQTDGTCVTWAFCILPGRLDQVASTWKRHDGTRATVLASGKTLRRRTRQ